jgi:hypothetical protein
MNSFRTLVPPTTSNNIQYRGIWYSKIQISPSRCYLKMLGTDNLYDDITFCFIGTYQKHQSREVKNPSNEDLLKHLNDLLYKDTTEQDCGCHNYEKTRKYPAIAPGKCNNNSGCQHRMTITISENSSYTPLEDISTLEEDDTRKKFNTPCGQTYWVDSENYLYTNKTVEHPIAYWMPEYQCVRLYVDDESDDSEDYESDDEPAPLPPPSYERSISSNDSN